MCKKCICLIRVSTVSQDLEGQREKVVANAIADGYKLDEIAVVEKKESAIKLSEQERESLNEMKEIISENPSIESVYVFAIDRLARKVSIVLSVKDYLTQRGINLVFINPHKMSTLRRDEKSGKMIEDELTSMLLMFLSYGAEMEMKIKMERFKAAKDVLRKNNKLASGKPLFGYRREKDGTVLVDALQANAVRYIFNEYLQGETMLFIYKSLVIKRLISPSKSLGSGQMKVRDILANPAYKGGYSYKDKNKSLVYPPIVDEDTFAKAQAMLAKNVKKHTKNVYYGKGLIRSGHDDYALVPISGVCQYVNKNGQVQMNININAVETAIWSETKLLMSLKKEIEHYTTPVEYEAYISENNAKIDSIKALLEEVEDRQRKAFNMYINGKVSESIYDEQMAVIEKDIAQWNKDIAQLESENKRLQMENEEYNDQTVFDPRKLDEIEDDSERKNIIDSLIEKVVVVKEDNKYYMYIIPRDAKVKKLYETMKRYYAYFYSNAKKHLIYYMGNADLDMSDNIIERFQNTNSKKHRQKIKGQL